VAGATIVAVEDEADLLELVRFNLEKDGYRVAGFVRGEDALQAIRARPPDLVLLDLMLPGMDGLELCRLLKGNPATAATPVVMLTAKGEEADIVAGLELGADDYVTKPFSPRVLLARVRAVLRRRAAPHPETAADGVLRAHELALHPGRREVTVAGRPVPLTFTEFNILALLLRRPGWVFTRGQIMDAARGADYHVTERAVDVQIVSLRRKLGPAGRHIGTVRGVGYRLED
jgi:two-component system phosphate regulon response regulator PhoB